MRLAQLMEHVTTDLRVWSSLHIECRNSLKKRTNPPPKNDNKNSSEGQKKALANRKYTI